MAGFIVLTEIKHCLLHMNYLRLTKSAIQVPSSREEAMPQCSQYMLDHLGADIFLHVCLVCVSLVWQGLTKDLSNANEWRSNLLHVLVLVVLVRMILQG